MARVETQFFIGGVIPKDSAGNVLEALFANGAERLEIAPGPQGIMIHPKMGRPAKQVKSDLPPLSLPAPDGSIEELVLHLLKTSDGPVHRKQIVNFILSKGRSKLSVGGCLTALKNTQKIMSPAAGYYMIPPDAAALNGIPKRQKSGPRDVLRKILGDAYPHSVSRDDIKKAFVEAGLMEQQCPQGISNMITGGEAQRLEDGSVKFVKSK